MPRLNVAWDVRGNGDVVLRGGAGCSTTASRGTTSTSSRARRRTPSTPAPRGGTRTGASPFRAFPRSILTHGRPRAGSTRSTPRRSTFPAPPPGAWRWRSGCPAAVAGGRLRGESPGPPPERDALELHRPRPPDRHRRQRRPRQPSPPRGARRLGRGAVPRLPCMERRFRVVPVRGDGGVPRPADFAHPARTPPPVLPHYTLGKVLGTTGFGDYAVIDPVDPRNRSYGVPSSDRTHIFNASYNLLVPDPIRADGHVLLRGCLNGWQSRDHALQQRRAVPPRSLRRHRAAGGPARVVGNDAHQPAPTTGTPGASRRSSSVTPGSGTRGRARRCSTSTGSASPPSRERALPVALLLPRAVRWNWDMSLFKNFGLGGSKRLQLRFASSTSSTRRRRCTRWATSTSPSRRVQRARGRRSERRRRLRRRPSATDAGLPLHRPHPGELREDRDEARHRVIQLAARFEF